MYNSTKNKKNKQNCLPVWRFAPWVPWLVQWYSLTATSPCRRCTSPRPSSPWPRFHYQQPPVRSVKWYINNHMSKYRNKVAQYRVGYVLCLRLSHLILPFLQISSVWPVWAVGELLTDHRLLRVWLFPRSRRSRLRRVRVRVEHRGQQKTGDEWKKVKLRNVFRLFDVSPLK